MSSAPTRGMLADLLRVLDRPGPLVIVPHDNPDPDAMASAVALKYIVGHQLRKDAYIALGGIVGRAENRAMRTYLNIKLAPVSEVRFDADVQVALVDTQPGRPNNSLPEGVVPTAVIDHHPAYAEYPGVSFLDLRDEYGATSTILTEYLRESRLEIEPKIATALFYGINSETQDLGREATAADIEASHFLYPYTNKRRLAKIENARVPREYFRVFREAIDRAALYDHKVVVSLLGDVQYPDMVAEVADFLLRLDEAEWSAAIGAYNGCLYCSVRTTDRDTNAGDLLQRVLGSKSAGGHDMIAGGRIPLGADPADRLKAACEVRTRLLEALGVDPESGKPLT
ncbi:MAG TPA: DHHA1 domain-containing protein [Candidatus Eisenbacteria bacterium]|nr:DHHA1 domain-containing protein [Candidatus Eisenbacteria bacterium]